MLHKLHNIKKIGLHTPQSCLLQLTVAQPHMVGVVITQYAEPVIRQVVRQGTGIQGGLAIARSDDDDRCVRFKRLAKMVVYNHDHLAA